jgi:abortive infection bacteriophage resistance protein
MAYSKPWRSYEQQLEQLIERGLLVTDKPRALDYLQRIGYYRLSGYWYPFRERSGNKDDTDRTVLDQFKPGASFENAVHLYVFDKKLRLLTLDALERIEVALRVDISHTLGQQHCFGYQEPDFFDKKFLTRPGSRTGFTQHQQWLARHNEAISRSKEEFIQHNKKKYGLPLAIWIACEIWDFGLLSKLFKGLKCEQQDVISRKYSVSNGWIFASWLRSLNYLRNVCAHHSRLWNRNVIDQPKMPKEGEISWIKEFRHDAHAKARPFLLLCITKHLLNTINPTSSWGERLKTLSLDGFPDLGHVGLNLKGMGAPDGWEAWPLWAR